MRNTTTTVVIAAGVVLAAVIVTRTPAQQEGGSVGGCCYPGGCADGQTQIECEAVGGTFFGDGVNCLQMVCNDRPTVVGIYGTTNQFTRAWSDGQVDVTVVDNNGCNGSVTLCTTVLLTGTCTTDINRDGDIGIQDFLTLLGGWGRASKTVECRGLGRRGYGAGTS